VLEVIFTPFVGWSERTALPDAPGVYEIAKGEEANLIYVGRTWCRGGLRDRIAAFHRSASTGRKGHAGGVTYHSLFGPDVSDLLVAAHVPVAINPAAHILRPYVDFAEKRAIWMHVQRFGGLPACNSAAGPDAVDS